MKLWTKNMRTSNISGPISSNKVSKRMAMGRKAAETHTNTRLEDGDNQRIGSRTTQTIATHDASCALHIDDG